MIARNFAGSGLLSAQVTGKQNGSLIYPIRAFYSPMVCGEQLVRRLSVVSIRYFM